MNPACPAAKLLVEIYNSFITRLNGDPKIHFVLRLLVANEYTSIQNSLDC